MEQDEDPDAHPGRRPRGHLGLRADGPGAGAAGDDGAASSELSDMPVTAIQSRTVAGVTHANSAACGRVKLTAARAGPLARRPNPHHNPPRRRYDSLNTAFLHAHEIPVRASARCAAGAGARRRHLRRSENPRRRPDHDRQPPASVSAASTRRRWTSFASTPRASAGPAASPRATNSIKHADNKSWTCHVRTDRPPRPQRGALRGRRRGHPEMDGEERMGAVLCRASPTTTMPMRKPRARPRPACGRAPSSRRGTGASATRRRRSSAPSNRRPNAHAILLASASGTGRALARLHHQGQRQPRRRMHLSQADQPLVCADQDADQQGHALVLFGRRSRSRRLPRDAGGNSSCLVRAIACRGVWIRRSPGRRWRLQCYSRDAIARVRPGARTLKNMHFASQTRSLAAGAVSVAGAGDRHLSIPCLAYLLLPADLDPLRAPEGAGRLCRW